jgi:hypothetical protein
MMCSLVVLIMVMLLNSGSEIQSSQHGEDVSL